MNSPPKGRVDSDYLRVTATSLQEIKQHSYSLMHIRPGDKVLDVGCGPGTDTLLLANLVGASGQVVGVDIDSSMIKEARKRSSAAGTNGSVTHLLADATALPFEEQRFDSCRSERLFQHLVYPEQALSEMIRVTRSGGRLVVVDTDWGSLSIDTARVDIERRLTRFHAENFLQNGFSGRQLPRLLLSRNLENVTVKLFPIFVRSYAVARQIVHLDKAVEDALAANVIDQDDYSSWHSNLEEADAAGVFFASCNISVVSGRKL